MIKSSTVLVSIRCTAYNHAPYIRECLDGFVMQKTTFRFEAVVHDDASTDNTAEIIREYAERYPDIIKPIFEKENQYSKHNGTLTRIMDDACIGKYIALCEGDDYWTDPYKLQKQVDFLESHPDYGMCYTKARIWEKGVISGVYGTADTSFEGLIRGCVFPTLTRMYRKSTYEIYQNDIKPEEKKWLMGDYPMAFYFVVNSRVGFIDDFTGVYRVLPESASHSNNLDCLFRFYNCSIEICHFFVDKYILEETKKNRYYELIKEMDVSNKITLYLNLKKRKEARLYYLAHRFDLNNYLRFIYNIKTSSLFLCKVMGMIKKIKDKIFD